MEPEQRGEREELASSEVAKVFIFGQMSDIDRIIELDALEPNISAQEENRTRDIFTRINTQVRELIDSRSIHAAAALRNLADLCRREEWRIPAAEGGLLETATSALTADTPGMEDEFYSFQLETQTHALRLIGNLCADIDENRARALQHQTLQAVLEKFHDIHFVNIAVAAAFNICNDFEPTREAAIEQDLFLKCMLVINSGVLRSTPSFSSLCYLLDIIHDIVDAKDAPPIALETLLKTSLEGDLEIIERLSLLRLTNKLLELESNQLLLVNADKVDLVLGSLFRTYSETQDPTEIVLSGVGQTASDDSSEEKELSEARNTLVQILSDISARPEFVMKYGVFTDPSMLVWKLKYVMLSPFVPVSQVACLMLGNLASSDDTCVRMVRDVNIHEPASMILKTTTDPRLIHAALGLVRNLALPAENKDSLAMVGVIENLQISWSLQVNPQIPLAAASLVRQVVNGSIANIQRLLLMSSPVDDESGAMQSQLAVLLKVYAKTDELAIKTEIARTITAILRCIYGAGVDEQKRQSILDDLYSHHTTLEIPVVDMILQSQYPVVRSEGWFGLGLMSRSEPGREMVSRHINEPQFFSLLQSTVAVVKPQGFSDEKLEISESAPRDSKVSETRDRDNALIVVHQLINTADGQGTTSQQQLASLLRLSNANL